MTAQFPEELVFQHETLSLCSEPLAAYLESGGGKLPELHCNTALDRGYIGKWAIVDDRLFLVDLRGEYADDRSHYLTLADVFPEAQGPVFAAWYSGTLRCPRGKRLKYVHFGWRSLHEQDLFLEIEQGMLKTERLVTNPPPPPESDTDRFNVPDFLRREVDE